MSAHPSTSFSTPIPSNLQRPEGKIPAQGFNSQPKEKQVGTRKKPEPGMLMKTQELSEFSGLFDGRGRNPFLENKEVINLRCRLQKADKEDSKMKVYPGMLMKINGLKNDKGNIRECYRKINNLSLRSGNVIETKGESH